jgi:hypothetical protein
MEKSDSSRALWFAASRALYGHIHKKGKDTMFLVFLRPTELSYDDNEDMMWFYAEFLVEKVEYDETGLWTFVRFLTADGYSVPIYRDYIGTRPAFAGRRDLPAKYLFLEETIPREMGTTFFDTDATFPFYPKIPSTARRVFYAIQQEGERKIRGSYRPKDSTDKLRFDLVQ